MVNEEGIPSGKFTPLIAELPRIFRVGNGYHGKVLVYASDDVHPKLAKLLRGVRWPECDCIELFSQDMPLAEMTPECFHYFLPAFLAYSTEFPDIPDSLCFYLFNDLSERNNERLGRLNATQRNLLSRFLNAFSDAGWEDADDIRLWTKIL